MKRLLLFICLLVIRLPVLQAQYSEMIGKAYPERLDAIDRLSRNVIGKQMDSIAFADTLQNMRTLGKDPENKELALEADLLEAYRDFRFHGRTEKVKEVMIKGKKTGISHIEGRCIYIIANDHWYSQRYEEAFHWYIRLDSMLQNIDIDDFPNKAFYLSQIGFAHYHFGDYHQAIGYFRKVAAYPFHDFYMVAWRHAVNNMGLSFQKLGQLHRSDSCFQILADQAEGHSERWSGIAAGNLGYNHYLREDYQKAVPLLEKDYRIAEQYEDFGLAAGAMIPLGDILVHQGKPAIAKDYLDKAKDYIYRSNQTDRLRLLFPVLSRWCMAMDQPVEAARFLDSALLSNKIYNEKYNALRLLHVRLEAMASQREAAVQQERAEKEKQIGKRNRILSLLSMIILGVIFIGYRNRKTAEIRLKNHNLMLLEARRDLQNVRMQLDTMTREASEKDRQIRQLQYVEEEVSDEELLQQLARQVIFTDEGWNEFTSIFRKIHPHFLTNIKRKYPTLTPAEIRCITMQKLSFNNKEMAALQGVSTNAVMVTKYRVRKKLGLATQKDFEKFVSKFN